MAGVQFLTKAEMFPIDTNYTPDLKLIILLSTGFLTMMYNTQNCLVFGLCPSSGILKTREHDVSGTGSVSVLR
jgi:hypothetical protein